jgi:hypothetical protein
MDEPSGRSLGWFEKASRRVINDSLLPKLAFLLRSWIHSGAHWTFEGLSKLVKVDQRSQHSDRVWAMHIREKKKSKIFRSRFRAPSLTI